MKKSDNIFHRALIGAGIGVFVLIALNAYDAIVDKLRPPVFEVTVIHQGGDAIKNGKPVYVDRNICYVSRMKQGQGDSGIHKLVKNATISDKDIDGIRVMWVSDIRTVEVTSADQLPDYCTK